MADDFEYPIYNAKIELNKKYEFKFKFTNQSKNKLYITQIIEYNN